MLRKYFLLIRAPNLFTVPSNILSGYFATTTPSNADPPQLLALIISSILLYASGIVLNDYFDMKVDKKERPGRPLASGSIAGRSALILAALSITVANILTLFVGWSSFIVSCILTSVIFGYNYRLKRNAISNPLVMGTARFLNVILGGSSALGVIPTMDMMLFFVGYCLFLYTAAISVLSRLEVSEAGKIFNRSYLIPIVLSFSSILFTVVSILIVGFFGYLRIAFIFNMIIFLSIMIVTFFHLFTKLRRPRKLVRETQYRKASSKAKKYNANDTNLTQNFSHEIQRTIKTLILSIIVLDSIFLSGLVGIYAGLAVILLIIPAILLGRRLYVT
jgi:4-hydroxybenzoate polyprenyltransferase